MPVTFWRVDKYKTKCGSTGVRPKVRGARGTRGGENRKDRETEHGSDPIPGKRRTLTECMSSGTSRHKD